MGKCRNCGEDIIGDKHWICGVCGSGICDECNFAGLETDCTDDPFFGYDDISDDQYNEMVKETQYSMLVCYNCEEKIYDGVTNKELKHYLLDISIGDKRDLRRYQEVCNELVKENYINNCHMMGFRDNDEPFPIKESDFTLLTKEEYDVLYKYDMLLAKQGDIDIVEKEE